MGRYVYFETSTIDVVVYDVIFSALVAYEIHKLPTNCCETEWAQAHTQYQKKTLKVGTSGPLTSLLVSTRLKALDMHI